MGTNYYHLAKPPCEKCGHAEEGRHIGKSSAGWCFHVHIYPDDGINTLDDWVREWSTGAIVDEYSRPVTTEEMLDVITNRSWKNTGNMTPEWLAQNHAAVGPNGLARGRDSIPGEGTWDYVDHEFS